MQREIINYRWPILFSIFIFLMFAPAFGSEDTDTASVKHEIKGFEPGDFIIDHIKDQYEWHLFTFNNKHYSIPLMIIVYSKNSGFHAFSSSKLSHGHEYKNFIIAESGEYEDKVVELDNNGEILGRPLDLSFTKNVFAIFISFIIMFFLFIGIANSYKRREDLPPKGLQSLIEPLIIFIRDDVAKNSIGERHYERFTPFLLTLFFFIFLNNLLGLIPIFPGGANVTGNITVTMSLALITFIVTSVSGNKSYWKHLFNPDGVPWWLKAPIPLIPFIELAGLFTKPFVLMVRLFANISAGHIVTLGFLSLIFIFGNMNAVMGLVVSPLTVLFTVFMTFLELLVAFIQAYVFTILSAIYIGMATNEEH